MKMRTLLVADLVRGRFAAVARCRDISARRNRRHAAAQAPATATASAQAPSQSVIRFEDATDKSGIHFTHSFGSAKLGSLLEGTGAGCVWFDYNNSGRPRFTW